MGEPHVDDPWRYDVFGARAASPRAWLVVAVAATVAIAAILLLAGASTRPGNFELIVWIEPTAPLPQAADVIAQTREQPGVAHCTFWSSAKDYSEALRLLPLQETVTLTPSTVPSSLRCRVASEQERRHAVERLTELRGVFTVSAPSVGAVMGRGVR